MVVMPAAKGLSAIGLIRPEQSNSRASLLVLLAMLDTPPEFCVAVVVPCGSDRISCSSTETGSCHLPSRLLMR
jgi:hypothetical protein